MSYAWDIAPTEIGPVLLVFADTALVACHVAHDDPQYELEHVARELGASIEHQPGIAADLAQQFDEYFAGDRHSFDVELDWRLTTGFARDALQQIAEIPYGTTLSYGEVAVLAGRPRAHRAVGTACKLTPFSLVVGVHRVIRSDGTPGEFGAHPETKRMLLELEGAAIR